MLLGIRGLERAVAEGALLIENTKKGFSEASQDIRVGTLYRAKKAIPAPDKATGKVKRNTRVLTQEQFIDDFLEEVPLNDAHVCEAGRGRYFFLPLESVTLSREFSGRVTSRSRAARDGYRIQSVDWFKDSLHDLGYDRERLRPLCKLSSRTNVLLRRGDMLAQAFFMHNGDSYFSTEELMQAIDGGKLGVYEKKDERGQRRLRAENLRFEHGMILTRHPVIKIYTGALIDPHDEDRNHAFKVKRIPRNGSIEVEKGSFVISSSWEDIVIPEGHIVYVAENPTDDIYRYFGAKRGSVDFKGSTHPRAPYVIQNKRITFENFYRGTTRLYAREPQSELFVAPLLGGIAPWKVKRSRFADQKEGKMSGGLHGND